MADLAEPERGIPPDGVAAVVLAAGRGERMGGRKLELPFAGRSILATVVRTLREAGVDETVVVLGHEPERLQAIVEAEGARWVVNPRHNEGMLTSVQCGLAAVAGAAAALVLPGDHPRVRPDTIRAVVAARRQGGGLVIPTWEGRRGHPLLLTEDLFALVGELDPAVGLRELRQRVPERVRYLPVDDPGILVDLDTPDDYQSARY